MSLLKNIRNWLKIKRSKMAIYSVEQIFTILQADVNYVKRANIDDLLSQEFSTPGKQLIVFGHSGGGKTTSVFKMLKEHKSIYIKTHCESYTTFEQLIINAFAELDQYFLSGKTTNKSASIKGSLSAEYATIKASIESTTTEGESYSYAPVVPPQLTPQKLAEFMGKGNIVWVIEDFHKVHDDEKTRIADVIKIFVDNSNQYPMSKIICIGACESAHDLITLNPDLKNRVSEIKIPLLNDDEIRQIIENGFHFLNIYPDNKLADKLVEFSDRIASAAHQMCLDICNKNNIHETSKNPIIIPEASFEYAINGFLSRNQDSLKTLYEKATKDSLGWYILKTISSNCKNKLSIDEIERIINDKEHPYSKELIQEKLDELISTSYSILYRSSSELYGFSTPFWHRFVKVQLMIEGERKRQKQQNKPTGKKRKNNRNNNTKNRNTKITGTFNMLDEKFMEVIKQFEAKNE